jgi:hypothetical protein
VVAYALLARYLRVRLDDDTQHWAAAVLALAGAAVSQGTSIKCVNGLHVLDWLFHESTLHVDSHAPATLAVWRVAAWHGAHSRWPCLGGQRLVVAEVGVGAVLVAALVPPVAR